MPKLTLIETGGTICMAEGPLGLAPAADKVVTALRQIDPDLALCHNVLNPLVDSADVGPDLWNDLLDRIMVAPGPLIITHGTDTMAFTGAALDAALAGQGKTVVLCGSMRPLGEAGSDAPGNLALALKTARTAKPGVVLAFDGQMLPAGALTKVHSHGDAAFAAAGDPVLPAPALARRFDPNLALAIVTLSPGLSAASLTAMLDGLDGAVLRVFGAGTVPAQLSDAITAAAPRCAMVAVSQCSAGGLSPGAYAAGAVLWAAGVQNGALMSPEQALIRLWLQLSAQPTLA